MKKILALLFLLVSTAHAQVQYCGSDSSQRTLVNNILRSEEFDNATVWPVVGTAATANTVVSPDGTTSAETVTATATTNGHYIWNQVAGYAATSGLVYRQMIRVKAGTATSVAFGEGSDAVAHGALFNLSTNAITGTTNLVSSSITDLSDSWKLLTITYTRTNTSNARLVLGFVNGSDSWVSGPTWLAAGTETFFIWGASVQLASAPSTYIRTTDTQVTAGTANTTAKVTLSNLALRSEEFDNAAWTKANITITANNIAAPDGTNTAELATVGAIAGTTSRYIYATSVVNLGNQSVRRQSWYLKKGTHSFIHIYSQYPSTAFVDVDLNAGTILRTGASTTSSSITSVGNGWYFVTFTHTPTNNNDANSLEVLKDATTIHNTAWTSAGTETFYIWGAQLNLAALPSDYLATTTAAATLANVCPAGTSQSLNDPSRCFAVTDNRIRRW